MKKTITLIILSVLLLSICPATTVLADSDWVPNWSGKPLADTYYYNGEWHKNPPSKPGITYTYNGQTYVSGGSTPSQTTSATQPTQPVQPQQTVKPYYYDGAWHTNMPTEYSKSFWYNGAWYTTAAAPAQPSAPTQRPSAYVDNTASAKAQDLINYAVANGVAGSYVDSTDSTTVAQKHITFTGKSGSFDMTLTAHIGSDGNYVTKYWRAGIERSLSEVQGMILGCR